MLIIDFNSPNFEISFDIPFDDEEGLFNDYVMLLKKLYLRYEPTKKVWLCKINQIEEILAWLDKKGYQTQLKSNASNFIQELKKSKYEREIETFKFKTPDFSILNSNLVLFNCHKEGWERLLKSTRSYCADDPGMGKTIEALITFSQWYKEKEVDGIFLVVRKGLPYHWKHEILTYSNVFKEEDIIILTNKTQVKPFTVFKDKKIIITPNHLLGDIFTSYRKDYNNLKSLKYIDWGRPFVDIKKEWEKQKICCVVDEAHELNNPDSIRTKALFSHKHCFDYRLSLSATPAVNYFERWWAALHFLDPSLIPMSYNTFRVWLADELGDKWDRFKIRKYNIERVNEVRKILQKVVLKRTKKDLPEFKSKKTIKPIFLEMPELQKEMYKTIFTETIQNLEEEHDKVTGGMLVANFFHILNIVDNPLLMKIEKRSPKLSSLLSQWSFEKDSRLEYLEGALEDYFNISNKKVIIFDNHPLTLELLSKKFQKYHPLMIHGQLNDTEEERFQKQNNFNDPKSKNRLFLLSTKIGGPGFNLHKHCSKAIAWSLPYDTVLFLQMQDRVHRITSEEDVTFEPLILDKTIDVLRFNKNMGRVNINDVFLNKTLNEKDILEIFNGVFNSY
jgi:hypothetical protein